MMKWFFVLLLAAFVAAELSEECEYVDTTYLLTDIAKVKKCFETYQLDQAVLDTIVNNLDLIGEIYPYVEIAANPPAEPPGYFKAVNYSAGLAELKDAFNKSDRVISKVVRSTVSFVNGFRDGHFGLAFSTGMQYTNIFYYVGLMLPFTYEVAVDGDLRNVTLSPMRFTDNFTDNGSEIIQAKTDAGILAEKIDGKDAFEFLTTFLDEYNDMKSPQGRLVVTMKNSFTGYPYMYYPVESAFENHTILFSDGTTLDFNFVLLNPTHNRRDFNGWPKKLTMKEDESSARDKKFLEAIKNIDTIKREMKRSHEHYMLECGLIDDMNYIIIDTFSPESEARATWELVECVQEFDENDKPITVILPLNGGGSTAFRELIQFMLMPTADARTLRAARKTITTRYLGVDNGLLSISDPSRDCETMTPYEVEQFWNQEEKDTFGDAVHTRTKKFFESFEGSFDYIAKYRMQKHVRKPTEIILATDGFCFSSCAFFVDNSIRSGSAIVAGYGATAPGDEQFVAAQCPSRVLDPSYYFANLAYENYLVGIQVSSTFLESYNVSAKMDEAIPADYDILRIDKHCGYYKNLDPNITELLEHTKEVYEEFKTKCNPANKRLFLVTENCTSKDPNALYSGYVCGSNGEWDKKTCKISSCKPGYTVDFDNNKCVPNSCDPRSPYYPVHSSSSSEKPVPVSSQSSSSNSLYPMIGMIATAIIIAIHHLH